MPPADIDLIEKKSYTRIFFVTGTLFFLVSVWAFYDEVIDRRSWKDYQRQFNRLELKNVEAEIEKVKKDQEALDAQKEQIPGETVQDADLSLRRLRLKIEQSELRMEGKEFKKAQAELKKREIRLFDAKQRYGFAKADQDETYYEWKHSLAEGEGHAEKADVFKKKYYELEGTLGDLKLKVEEAEAQVTETRKGLNVYHDDLKKWQGLEKKYFEPIERLEKKKKAVLARGLDIKQTVIDDLGKGGVVVWGAVDRCESCHVAINRDGFENEKNPFKTHPSRAEIFGKHPIEKFGCTTCHGGQGRATQISGKPLKEGEGDFAHGLVHHWPDPLLEADALSSTCNKCHQDQWRLGFAATYMEGKKLFWDLGCTGCHAVKGFENASRVGPSLRKVASKVNEEWLMAWVKNPRDYLPHTKMPRPPLDIEEPNQGEKIAAYILQSSEPYDLPFGRFSGGNAEEGRKAFETVGCLGCHILGDKGAGLAPALDKIASKTTADWIYNWIQNPKAYNSEVRMPSLRLSPQEAANITAYLMQQGVPLPKEEGLEGKLRDAENAKKGFLLVSQFGCYGCHNIKGFENASKLSVELTVFGKKDVVELDYGDTKVPRTWEDWTAGKLKDPRMYLTEKTSSKMPNFGLTDEQIHSLVIFLKGLKKEEVPERYQMSKMRPGQRDIDHGRRLVERLNCKGCHTIEGEGRLIEQVVGADKAPPILDGIGARVRPDWMFRFLKDPSLKKIRPWIEVRMPTFQFTDDEANTIIKYFSALNKVPAEFSTVSLKTPDPEMLAAGAKLASTDYFSCFNCHIQGAKMPPTAPEQWGPDLSLARERIRYEFIPEWVKDPQVFTPGVKMPAFLPSDDAAAPGILDGNRQKQAEALRDYLMSLGAVRSSSEGP